MTAAPNTMQTARLGLVVSKRALRRSVDRNRAKRVIRETFRASRQDLPEMDIIVQVTGPSSKDDLREALGKLLGEMRNMSR